MGKTAAVMNWSTLALTLLPQLVSMLFVLWQTRWMLDRKGLTLADVIKEFRGDISTVRRLRTVQVIMAEDSASVKHSSGLQGVAVAV